MRSSSSRLLRRAAGHALEVRPWILVTTLALGGSPRASTDLVRDVADDAGVAEMAWTWSAAAADYDADGDPDLLIVRHGDPARLYRNDGGVFEEVLPGSFGAVDRHDCAWGDVDLDGRLDVYCSLGAERGTAAKSNELWMQQPDGTFVDLAEEFRVADPYGRGRHVTFIDVDHDPYPDLFVGNDYPRRDGRRSPNRLFLNLEGSSFARAVGYRVNREIGARCAQAIDFDLDGWEDLLVCGKEGLKLYRNLRGRDFRDVSGTMDVAQKAQAALLTRVNADRLPDLVQIASGKITVRIQTDRRFRRPSYARRAAHARWISAGDVDGDADTDLYVVRGCDADGRNRPDLLLLRGTRGRYTSAKIPQAASGCGDVSEAFDRDDDLRDDILVLNGRGQRGLPVYGPVQLLSAGH